MDSSFLLANKIVLITGGGTAAVGRAIAELFAQNGTELVLIAKSEDHAAVTSRK